MYPYLCEKHLKQQASFQSNTDGNKLSADYIRKNSNMKQTRCNSKYVAINMKQTRCNSKYVAINMKQ